MLAAAVALLVAVPVAYGRYGSGVEFFPNVEPEYGLLYVHARGNLSIEEKDALVRQAEARILGWPSIESVYTRVGGNAGEGGDDVDEDVVGVIQYEFVDWRERQSADADPRRAPRRDDRHSRRRRRGLGAERRPADRQGDPGPALRRRSGRPRRRRPRRSPTRSRGTPDVIDVSDGLPAPGVDWELEVDRGRGRAVRRLDRAPSAAPSSSSPTG